MPNRYGCAIQRSYYHELAIARAIADTVDFSVIKGNGYSLVYSHSWGKREGCVSCLKENSVRKNPRTPSAPSVPP